MIVIFFNFSTTETVEAEVSKPSSSEACFEDIVLKQSKGPYTHAWRSETRAFFNKAFANSTFNPSEIPCLIVHPTVRNNCAASSETTPSHAHDLRSPSPLLFTRQRSSQDRDWVNSSSEQSEDENEPVRIYSLRRRY